MKTIYKMARTELQTLFYSPIAWLILVVFTFQASLVFSNGLAGCVRNQELGYGLYNVTMNVFAGWRGMFTAMQQYLYLYIPLLTMGLMSRELSSGSIKLLYSSPVTNTQIILGKYLSMMIYNLVLMCIFAVYLIFAAITIKSADIPLILSGCSAFTCSCVLMRRSGCSCRVLLPIKLWQPWELWRYWRC